MRSFTKSDAKTDQIRLAVSSGGLDCLERMPSRPPAPTAPENDERRREPRFAVTRSVSLRVWLPPDFEIVAAEVRDISRSGIGLVAQTYLAPGAQIEFRVGEFQIFAEVRHCRRSLEHEFVLGARIQDVVLPDGQHCSHLGE